jgi:hypothetical protein
MAALQYTAPSISASDIAVPPADSAANVAISDVIGNKLDTHLGNSLYSRVDAIFDSIQREREVYPTLAAGATVISANGDWAYGAYATIVPAGTIVNDFHILGVSIESCDKNAVFQLELYKGAADDIVTAVRFAVEGGFFGNQVYIVGSEDIDANAQVRARLASSDGAMNQATITVSVIYWEHA